MKNLLLFFLKLAISAGLVIWAFSGQKITSALLLDHLRSAHPLLLLTAVLLFVGSIGVGALQWNLLLRTQEIRLPWKRVLSFYFVGVFFNNVLVGNVGGDAVRIYDVRRVTKDGSAAFVATFLDRFIGLFAMICFAIVAYVGMPSFPQALAVLGLILALMAALSGLMILVLSRRLSRAAERAVRRVVPMRIGDTISRIRGGMLRCRSNLRHLWAALGIALGVQFLRILVHYVTGRSLGVDLSFGYFLIFIPLIAVVASVPISLGGIGVRENFGVLLFSRVGMPDAMAFSMEFLAYLVGLAASLVGGLLFLFRGMGKCSAVLEETHVAFRTEASQP